MSPEMLLREFDAVADAPDGVRRLRELILQLAVRGKLVPQDPSDEPASALLEWARTEQEQLIASGDISNPKRAAVLQASDLPYEVPPGWRWTRLGNAVAILDSRRVPVKESERLARIAGKAPDDLIPYYGATQQVGWIDDFLFNEELVLLGEDGAPFFRDGKEVAYVVSGRSWVNNHAHVLRGLAGISNRYLCHVLNVTDYHGFVTGTTRLKLTQGKMVNLLIPLPPVPEQRRVVERVDHLMAVCDELEERQRRRVQKRDRLNRAALHHLTTAADEDELTRNWARIRENFELLYDAPETVLELRQTVLQLAVRGKLVPQDPSDEPASVLLERIEAERQRRHVEGEISRPKRLSPIKSDEMPFEVAEGWVWARFGQVTLDIEAGWSPSCESRPREGSEWGVLKISAVSWGRFDPQENKALPTHLEPRQQHEVRADDFLMSRANTAELVGRSVVVGDTPPRLLLNDKTLRVLIPESMDRHYLNLYNNSATARAYYATTASGTSSSMRNLSREQIGSITVPVPPLAEQRRIVKRVDQLMALCDELEAKLTQARTKAGHVASSVVHHLSAA